MANSESALTRLSKTVNIPTERLIHLDNETITSLLERIEQAGQHIPTSSNELNYDIAPAESNIKLNEKISQLNNQYLEATTNLDILNEQNDFNKAEINKRNQEISLLKEHKIWMNSELQKTAEELNTYREENDDQLSKLKRKVVDVTDQNKLLLSTQKHLRQRNSELSNMLDKTSSELKTTKDNLTSRELEFSKESSENEKIKDVLTEQLKQFENKIKNDIENSSDAMESWERNRLISEIATTKNSLDEYKQKCFTLQSMIDSFISEKNDSGSSALPEFSQYSSSSTEVNSLKRQLLQDRQQKEELHKQLEILVAEMETKMPQIETFKKRTEELEHELLQSTDLLDKLSNEKMDVSKEMNIMQRKKEDRSDTMKLLRIQRNDLARQVQFLLLINSQYYSNEQLLSPDEVRLVKKIVLNENENDYSDSQKVISDRLVDFSNIKELQTKNMELLSSVRGLAKELESNENDETPAHKNKTIKEAKLAIIDLQNHVTTLEERIKVLTKERDSLTLLVPGGNNSLSSNGVHNKNEHSALEVDLMKYEFVDKEQNMIKKIQEMKCTSKKQVDTIHNLTTKLQNTTAICSQLKQQSLDLENEVESLTAQRGEMKKSLERADDLITKMNDSKVENLQRMENLQDKLDSQQQQYQYLQEKIKKLTNEKGLSDSTYIQICEEKNELKIELDNLKIKMNALINTQSNSEETCEKLEKELKSLSKETTSQEQMLQEIETSRKNELEWYQNEISTINKKYSESENALQKLRQKMEEQLTKTTTSETSTDMSQISGEIPEMINEDEAEYTKYISNAIEKYTLYKTKSMMREEQTTEDKLAACENITKELYYSVTVIIAQNKSLRKRLDEAQKELEDTKAQIKIEDCASAPTIENEIESFKLLENQLSFVSERVETLTTQNDILLEKLSVDNNHGIQNSNDDILSALKHERDILSQRVDILERETRIQAQAIENAKSTISTISTSQQESISKNHGELLDKVNELNILQEKNKILEDEIRSLTNERKHNQEMYDDLKSKVALTETAIGELRNEIQERDQRIRLLQEECDRWKEHSTRLSNTDITESKEFTELKLQCDSLRAELTSKDIESKDLDEKFNRLKKQAHERLDSNKLIVNQLNNEIDNLKVNKQELESQLMDRNTEINKMKLQLDDFETKKEASIDETTNIDIMNSDIVVKNVDNLKREIIYLKGKLALIDESSKDPELTDYITKLDGIKREFQEINNDRVEVGTSSGTTGAGDEVGSISNTEGGNYIDDKKKLWKEEWEVETLKRIDDAKEDLKKHLRQPTEEKINRVIERRKKELQDNFDEMVEQKAKSLILTNEINLTTEQIKDEIKENLHTEMKSELELVRKKSFEEGRQQELMKTKLLERKLSKLEDRPSKRSIQINSSLVANPQVQDDIVNVENKQSTPSILGQIAAPVSNPFAFSAKSSTSSFGTSGKAASPFGTFKPTGFMSAFGNQASPFNLSNGNSIINAEKSGSDSPIDAPTKETEPISGQKNALSETSNTEERPNKRTKTDE